MEKKIRFRNHISVVLEQLGAASWVVFVLLLTNVDDVVEFFENGTSEEINMTALIVGAVLFGILVLACIYQLLLWSKTYISICDNSIVIERNTLHKKKNTIGIKNISNVNTEQNLFEMFLGTCKVKLDTNSMSTADQTDVKILLKKTDAEQLKSYIMKLMRQCKGEEEPVETQEVMVWNLEAQTKDMVKHGFLSINIFSVFIALGSFVGVVGIFMATASKISAGESLAGILLSVMMAAGMCISAIWDIVKGFIRYYGFKIARREDKLHICYGFFKKVDYTIPIEKINGVILRQSFTARITGQYMAEIINIGMGDDAAEAEAFLFPYCKKESVKVRLKQLLPELEYTVQMEYEKQPKEAWIAWLWPSFLYLLFAVFATVAGVMYMPKYSKWMLTGAALVSLWALLLVIAYYRTAGSRFGEEELLLVQGYFRKTYCFLPYRKIQYVELKQNFPAKLVRLQKGEIHLLASARNRIQNLPYFPEEDGEIIKERIIQTTEVR